MKKILIIILVIVLCGCNVHEKKQNTNSTEEILNNIISENNYVILDVRTKEEFDEGHLVGAINIEYDKIDDKIDLDKNKTILVYCRSGRRSKIAYDNLKNMGYEVVDLGSFDSIDLEKESSKKNN